MNALRFDLDDNNDAMIEASYDTADMAPDRGEGIRGLSSAERLEDAKQLALMGFGPAIVVEMTHWQHSFARRLCDRVNNRKVRGGRLRSSLVEIFRIPVLHTTLSRFVMAIEHQLAFWGGERRLNSRVFLGAVNFVRTTMPEEFRQIPATALYSVALETCKRTVKLVTCSRCRGHYAQAGVESRLTDLVVYDCPFCRQIAAIVKPKSETGDEVPTSLANLKLREPIKRFPSKGADGHTVRAVLSLVYSVSVRRS